MGNKEFEMKSGKASASLHMHQVLAELGMDCDLDPSTQRTPERFVEYLREFFNPVDAKEILGEGFDASSGEVSIHGMVVQTNIPFAAICEHHLLPMVGYAHVGYIPNRRVVGISKLTRIVKAYGKERPSLQETINEKIADALFKILDSKGSIVVIKASHGCMSARGVSAPGVLTVTSSVRGLFRDVGSARQEFFSLIETGGK